MLESAQYSDLDKGNFFMRIVLESPISGSNPIKENFLPVAEKYNMDWCIQDYHHKAKVLIMVSKQSHCLIDLLHKSKYGNLPIDVVGIVSNHEDLHPIAQWYQVPFYHLPITKENKQKQEQKLNEIAKKEEVDFIVLARYMQILSDDFCQKYVGRIINIHHSFLPSFKGAKPYHQAYERGVKIIGATAHYVTCELDEGPIIEQEVAHVSHSHTPEDLVRVGMDIEALVLTKAVRLEAEKRIFLDGNKTVIFKR